MQAVAFAPLLPLPLIAALAVVALVGVGAGALARADRLVAARPRRARAARRARRAVAPPRGPHAGARTSPSSSSTTAPRTASPAATPSSPQALDGLQARLDRLGQGGRLEVRTVHVADRGEDGTLLLTALAEATAELPADRIAGAILVTDGQVHDPQALATFPGPVQVLLTGSAGDWDRRVVVETAPAFAIVGEPVSLVLRVEDLGAAPAGGGFAPLSISLDGTEPLRFDVPLNRSVTLPVTLQRGGVNVLQIATPEVAGELTDAQQPGDRLDQRRARPAARAARLRRALSGRAHLAEPAEVRQRGRPRAFHHPAPAGEAGLRAGLRALADRLPDPGAVHGEGRRVRPDHLRPLQAPRHPARTTISTTSPATSATAGRC